MGTNAVPARPGPKARRAWVWP